MIMQPASVFDSLAPTYDADFTYSGIGRLQRERVWSFLLPVLNAKDRPLKILEINCGTGEDALRLASMGHTVIATDASGGMIDKAKQKLSESSASLKISFEVCAFDRLISSFEGEEFDLVFSNFGGLNCIDQPAMLQLAKDLCALTKPDADLFLVILSSCCLWEIGHYGLRAKFKTAFRRFRKAVDFTVNEQTTPVHYYSPRNLKRIFSRAFKFQRAYPVGLFVPPSYLEESFAANPRRLQQLNAAEKKYGYSFLSGFADHYCAILKNRGTQI